MNTNRSGMGGHAPHGQRNASDARFVACPGKAEGRKKAEQPPALQSVGDPVVLLPASYPCARQSAIQRTPPSSLPPCPDPVRVDWGLPACATRFTAHSPTLRTGFIADDTPQWRKRLPRPSSESVGLQSSSAGVRSRALVLLGSLHVELSSWRRGNHPPLQQLAPPPIPVDRVEVSFVLPPTQEKQKTWEPPTPAAVRTVTCTQTGRWEASPGIRRDRWETTDPGVRTSSFAARAWCATSGRLPSEIHRHPGHRTNAPATPSPCAKSKPAVGLLCWAMNRDIGAPLQPRSPQPPHASRRAKLRAHQARHENPAGRRLDTKTTPLSPPARTERGPHNRTPATQTPTAHLVDGRRREEERKTQNAPRNGRRHPPGDAQPPPPQPQAK